MHLNSAQINQASIIWVLVADGARAQIYRYHKNKKIMPMRDSKREPYEQEIKRHELTPVPAMKFEVESLNDFQVSHDGRGSKIGGACSGHNTCEPHLDIHDEVQQNLVEEIADKLKQARETKAFDHLIIAAPSKILGALRHHLDTTIRDCVIAEIDKDFTNDKADALLAHLEETFAEAHLGS
jgi:protein required for attachment to host cells